MNLRKRTFVRIFPVVLLACVSIAAPSRAQEFKIETAIHAGDQKMPVHQNVTLFQNGVIVDLTLDFANPPNVVETKVYDSRQKKVALLDHKKLVQVELSDNHLLQMVDGLRRDISQREDLKFLVNETFKETQQIEISKLVLKSPTIRYSVEGSRPADPNYLKVHGEFLDIFTRLNASHPGGFPPFARLRLNQAIKKMGWIPSKIELEVGANVLMPNGAQMKSTHVLIDGLSKEDVAKIEKAKKQWISYSQVSLLKYRGIDRTASLEKTVEESSTTK